MGARPAGGDGAEEVSEEAPEAEAVPAPVEAAAAARPALHGAERGEEVLAVAPEGDHGAQGPQVGGGGVSVTLAYL